MSAVSVTRPDSPAVSAAALAALPALWLAARPAPRVALSPAD